MDKTDFGSYGVVGGMTVIVMLAYIMRKVRGGIAAEETSLPWGLTPIVSIVSPIVS